jgi:hypothetical protein
MDTFDKTATASPRHGHRDPGPAAIRLPGAAARAPAAAFDPLVFHPCPADPRCRHCGGAGAIEDPTGGALPDWSFLDGAYCISLQHRADRAASAAAQLHRTGLCRLTLFHRPVKNTAWPVAGIWEAHRAVALHALASGKRTVLILEDDVVFSRSVRPTRIRGIAAALGRLPDDWMIFYLGHMSRWAFLVRRNVLRVSSTAAHAYIASPRLLGWLRDRPFGTPNVDRVRLSGRGIDAAYARLPAAYALFPLIATQSASPSDHVVRPGKRLAIKKPKHLFTRTRYRELILSKAMTPAQYAALVISPLYFGARRLRRQARRMAAWRLRSLGAG